MENDDSQKNVMKESKEYISVSTRLPAIDVVNLKLFCKIEGVAPSEFIRGLIQREINSPRNKFLSGKNKIVYNKLNNTFDWKVRLDSGNEIDVLKDIQDSFILSLKKELDNAVVERNEWVHQKEKDSVIFPKELVGGER